MYICVNYCLSTKMLHSFFLSLDTLSCGYDLDFWLIIMCDLIFIVKKNHR